MLAECTDEARDMHASGVGIELCWTRRRPLGPSVRHFALPAPAPIGAISAVRGHEQDTSGDTWPRGMSATSTTSGPHRRPQGPCSSHSPPPPLHSVGCGCEVPRFVETQPWRLQCGGSCANVRWVPEGLLRAGNLPCTEYFAGGAIHYFTVNHPQPGRGRL